MTEDINTAKEANFIKNFRDNAILYTLVTTLFSLHYVNSYYSTFNIPIVHYMELSEVILIAFTHVFDELLIGTIFFVIVIYCTPTLKAYDITYWIVFLTGMIISNANFIDTDIRIHVAVSFCFYMILITFRGIYLIVSEYKIDTIKTAPLIDKLYIVFGILFTWYYFSLTGSQKANSLIANPKIQSEIDGHPIVGLYVGETRGYIFFYQRNSNVPLIYRKDDLTNILYKKYDGPTKVNSKKRTKKETKSTPQNS